MTTTTNRFNATICTSANAIWASAANTDPAALWIAAADLLAQYENLTDEDIADLIGPQEDPELDACVVTIMTSPRRQPAFAFGRYEDVARLANGVPGFADLENPANDNGGMALSDASC